MLKFVVSLKSWTQAKSSHSMCFRNLHVGCWGAEAWYGALLSSLSTLLREPALGEGSAHHSPCSSPQSLVTCLLGISAAGPAGTLHSLQPKQNSRCPTSLTPSCSSPAQQIAPPSTQQLGPKIWHIFETFRPHSSKSNPLVRPVRPYL